ncbi:hypothetical protein IFM89_013000 [Coptis chinensis]|uniref:Uncharacterized protein n=1 Tax=Coptis chinensis TaxID=261450 RepID=A0A835IYR2_9MAGN|nr:hypothetical protein IFM89_013000 [Coptis chinensis]
MTSVWAVKKLNDKQKEQQVDVAAEPAEVTEVINAGSSARGGSVRHETVANDGLTERRGTENMSPTVDKVHVTPNALHSLAKLGIAGDNLEDEAPEMKLNISMTIYLLKNRVPQWRQVKILIPNGLRL